MKGLVRWIGFAAFVALVSLAPPSPAKEDADTKLGERLLEAKAVYQELLSTPDRSVPEQLQENCKCIVVIPGMIKGALGFGARWGKGVMSCRNGQGGWSPPIFVSLKGGSWGLQIGAEKTDLVLFFMTERGARSLVTSSKFTLGGKISVAAGPLGRSGEASTDLKLNAEIYSYAKSKGLFAGISLEGARLAPQKDANAEYYGKPIGAQDLLFGHNAPVVRAEAKEFLAALPQG
ncbi:MAG: lipid-binding SYLF domain-containing protein [Candidatus Eisenbacteria bacterium]|uniref:Lipid-binding SYLF domain-containing protein n=1 Tax=Eiseniibacteriota bacterium TaxID=2212470 RepID=A0A538T0Y8_UNCEI|nr:MAG: lipid-binding SYLF domain-containing protein [Candidatus Eisenbacteria bacterium]